MKMRDRNVLQIYFLTDIKSKKHEDIIVVWKKFFNVEIHFIKKDKLKDLSIKKVDFLFVSEQAIERECINWEFINNIRIINPYFKLVWLLEKFDVSLSPKYLKAGADDILYKASEWEYLKWKSIALLRRRWELFTNDNIVFHRGLIVDKLKNQCMLNEKVIELSKKEFEVLQFLIDAPMKVFIDRDEIYKKVWKNEDKDTTRVVQQIIQNLKKKIGPDYFLTVRNKGIKLN